MRQTLIGIISCITIIYAYLNLPLEWRRHKDIQLAQTLSQNIEQYRQQHAHLPVENNSQILKQLGFRHHKDTGWQPNYRKLDETHYQIIYKDGYEPPYLNWDSRNQKWSLVNE